MYFNNQRLLRQPSLSSVPVVRTCIVQDERFPSCFSDFPLVSAFQELPAPQHCVGEVKEETEMLENSQSDRPAAKEQFHPLLPPFPTSLMAFQVGRSIPVAGNRPADAGICCSRSCSSLLLGYSEGRFLLPSFQSPS